MENNEGIWRLEYLEPLAQEDLDNQDDPDNQDDLNDPGEN